ncbi:Intraflagellar transport protein 74-like [Stylophora pistillata]|uniref:Intraflagellar transport protein 74-like n=1 Tax=Stylophora pistillata TaxID=50429 RepID=A0A2B4RUD8_STYPI|nr:Intraflagellar transport protein 74-like [Stylophora pistillata]
MENMCTSVKTFLRHITAMGRPPGTAAMRMPPGTGMVPGTARPGSRAGEMGGALNAQIRVAERPMTKQGLTGMRTSAGRGPQRAIYDKSFYMGQLRAKITELAAEIAKMQREVDQFNQENATFLTYEKRAEGLATEIKELQGQLADYNTLLDKINTDTEMDDIVQDFNALKIQNEREQKSIDELFTQRRDKEQQIKQLEIELDQERRMAESLVEDMPPDQRAKYAQLKNVNNSLQAEVSSSPVKQEAVTLYEKLNELGEKKQSLLDEMEKENKGTPAEERERLLKQVKEDNQEIASMERNYIFFSVTLYEKLNELGEKKQSLLDEMEKENKGTPAEERERLLKQRGVATCIREYHNDCSCKINLTYLETEVKEDNQEIASMERKTSELREKIETVNGEIQQLDMDLEEHQGERNVKYKELKKREETMDEFLETFEEVKANEQARKQQLESNIVNVLEHMSRGMARTKHLPSPAELQRMKDDLNFKETEMHKSQSTAASLGSEHTRLQMDLEKVEQELETFSDLDALTDQSEEKKTRLYKEKKTLSARKETFKKHVQSLSSFYDATKSKLMENETHSQLGNLERKWQHHEQNNFVMKEFIATKSLESDYRPLKQNVSEQLEDINKLLIQSLGK